MLFENMKDYWGFVLERGSRLTDVAIEMNRLAVWEKDQMEAAVDNLEADKELIKQSLRLG